MSKFVIVDLEMCTVPPKEKERTQRLKNEIIQIGAVLLDDFFEIADSFVTFAIDFVRLRVV